MVNTLSAVQREVTIQCKVDVDADRLWAVLADFGGFLKWAGEGDIRLEGEGIGAIRHLSMAGSELAEKLDKLDHDDKIIEYSLVYGEPIGMKVYSARVQVMAVHKGASELNWLGRFVPVDPESADQVAELLIQAYQGMTAAITAYVKTS